MLEKRTEKESKAYFEGLRFGLELCDKHGLEKAKMMIDMIGITLPSEDNKAD